jgi:hypothetical protein
MLAIFSISLESIDNIFVFELFDNGPFLDYFEHFLQQYDLGLRRRSSKRLDIYFVLA